MQVRENREKTGHPFSQPRYLWVSYFSHFLVGLQDSSPDPDF